MASPLPLASSISPSQMTFLPDYACFKVFSHLNRKEYLACARVSVIWNCRAKLLQPYLEDGLELERPLMVRERIPRRVFGGTSSKFREVLPVYSKISPYEIDRISVYIRNYACLYRGDHAYLNAERTRLARSIEFFPDGTVYIHLNRKSKQDLHLREGSAAKSVKYSVCYQTGEVCIRTTSMLCEDQQRECIFLALLRHVPNVVKIYHYSVFSSKKGYYKLEMLMPYYKQGDLEIAEFPPNLDGAKIVTTLIKTLVAIHRSGILHRDLKPANVFLDADFNPVIGDFGSACHINEGVSMKGWKASSPGFIPPEIENEDHPVKIAHNTSYQADVYGLGVTLRTFNPTIPLSPSLQALIKQMQEIDPQKRAFLPAEAALL